MELTHLDLFSGIGGFALAARWVGLKTIQFVELDKFCCKVLNKNFPGVPIHNDIKTFRYNETSAQPFLLTGGFPCQPFSCAGKQRGTDDNRYLWPEMLRVISEAKPKWIIGENVRGFISNNNGMVFENCCLDLEREGYSVQAFIIPACAVNAPHRRDRVWIVANRRCEHGERAEVNGKLNRPLSCEENASMSERPTSNDGQGINSNTTSGGCFNGCDNRKERHIQNAAIRTIEEDQSERGGRLDRIEQTDSHAADTTEQGLSESGFTRIGELQKEEREGIYNRPEQQDCDVSISESERLEGSVKTDRGEGQKSNDQLVHGCRGEWDEPWLEVASRLCVMDDELSSGLVGYLGITEEHLKRRDEHRVQKLKALGNAIVPSVAYEIMKAILEAERSLI